MDTLPYTDENPTPPRQPSPPPMDDNDQSPIPEERPSAVIERILALPTFSSQVDEFASLRGYFAPEANSHSYAAIQAYLSDSISVDEAVQRIATPIEEAYTTADHGRKLADSVAAAAAQESFEGDTASTEGFLWDLYYSFLHAARCTPWTDAAQQDKLVNLLRTLKARPDPEPPTKSQQVEENWVLGAEGLWSNLILMGPSFRESWNDSVGCGAGWQDPEIKAWTNVNAFVARVTATGVSNYWMYCIWAMRDALEDPVKRNEKYKLDGWVPAAAVWVLICGRQLYEREKDLTPKNKYQGNPGRPGDLLKGKPEFSKQRWAFWKGRLLEVAEDQGVRIETAKLSGMTHEFMAKIEREVAKERDL